MHTLPTKEIHWLNIHEHELAIKIQALLQHVTLPFVMLLSGQIGAGKTTFLRLFFKGLGVTSKIKSPTYSIVESYETGAALIHHFDLYRIQDSDELEYFGFREYFSGNAICCIEWPEQAFEKITHADISLSIDINNDGSRNFVFKSLSNQGNEFLSRL